MFGEVKLGGADYTAVWETLLLMSNILCQISWKRPSKSYSLIKAFPKIQFFRFMLLENAEKTFANFFREYDKTRNLC